MNRLLQLLGRFVQFSYACWDRIVLRGYYPRLQRPANIVHLFGAVGGEARFSPRERAPCGLDYQPVRHLGRAVTSTPRAVASPAAPGGPGLQVSRAFFGAVPPHVPVWRFPGYAVTRRGASLFSHVVGFFPPRASFLRVWRLRGRATPGGVAPASPAFCRCGVRVRGVWRPVAIRTATSRGVAARLCGARTVTVGPCPTMCVRGGGVDPRVCGVVVSSAHGARPRVRRSPAAEPPVVSGPGTPTVSSTTTERVAPTAVQLASSLVEAAARTVFALAAEAGRFL